MADELENAQKKIELLENNKKKDREKQNEFNQKIDECHGKMILLKTTLLSLSDAKIFIKSFALN